METLNDYRFYPTRFDANTIDVRLKLMEPICREILETLTPDDRAVLEEYLALLRDQGVLARQAAYNSGIQIGLQKAKRR